MVGRVYSNEMKSQECSSQASMIRRDLRVQTASLQVSSQSTISGTQDRDRWGTDGLDTYGSSVPLGSTEIPITLEVLGRLTNPFSPSQ